MLFLIKSDQFTQYVLTIKNISLSRANPFVTSEVSFHGVEEAVRVFWWWEHCRILPVFELFVSLLYFLFKVVGSHEVDNSHS